MDILSPSFLRDGPTQRRPDGNQRLDGWVIKKEERTGGQSTIFSKHEQEETDNVDEVVMAICCLLRRLRRCRLLFLLSQMITTRKI